MGGAGATLSGGQRARLALARALYHGADVLLIDDCLASVDAPVAAWILRHALLGPPLPGEGSLQARGEGSPPLLLALQARQQQLAGEVLPAGGGSQLEQEQVREKRQQGPAPWPRPRTLLVVTHSPELLAAADLVVEMRDGAVGRVLRQPHAAQLRARLAAATAASLARPPAAVPDGQPSRRPAVGGSEQREVQDKRDGLGCQALVPEAPPRRQQEPTQQEEGRQLGHVRWGVYRRYAAATGWGWVAAILLSLLLMQARHGCCACTSCLLCCARLEQDRLHCAVLPGHACMP